MFFLLVMMVVLAIVMRPLGISSDGKKLRSEQAEAIEDLTADLLAKMDTKFSELDASTQAKFVEGAKDIAKLRDDFESAMSGYRDRFRELVDYHRSGGEYRGALPSREMAEAHGRAVVAMLTGRTAGLEEACKRAGLQTAAMQPSSGAAGSYLVAPQIVDTIIRNVEEYGVFEANANRPALQSLTGFRIRRTGGLQCYYPDLGVAPTASDMTFGRIEYNPTRWAAYCIIDNWMLETDAFVAISELVMEELALAFAYSGDLNGFMGTGTSAYARVTGLMKRSGQTTVALVASNPGSVLKVTADTGDDTYAEVIAATSKYLSRVIGLLPQWADDGNAAFYLSREVFWNYLGARDSQSRPIADIFRTNEAPAMTLMSYPARITQVAPKLADTAVSTTLLGFGNLKKAVDLARFRNTIRARTSTEVKFLEAQTVVAMDAQQDIALADGAAWCNLETAAS